MWHARVAVEVICHHCRHRSSRSHLAPLFDDFELACQAQISYCAGKAKCRSAW